jgi:hypothetical protein
MNGPASHGADFLEIISSGIRIDVLLLPPWTAVVKAVPTAGTAKIIRNQSTGMEFCYREFNHLKSR